MFAPVTITAAFASPASFRTRAAVTYDARSVPRGSRVNVTERPNDKGGKNVTLRVWGLRARSRYDAYVYTRRCGATPGAAGARVQNGPSRKHYPQNEVWLDFRTDARGDGTAVSRQYWLFTPHQANSVVLFSHVTRKPVACVTVPFTW